MSNEDRSLAHPIEELRDLAELVRVLDRLVRTQEATEQRLSGLEQLQRSQWINDRLFSGGITLDANGLGRKSFSAPYGALTISDPNGLGPYLVANGNLNPGDLANDSGTGAGKWLIPQRAHMTVPLTGSELTIVGAPGAVMFVTVWVSPRPFSHGSDTWATADSEQPALPAEVPLVGAGIRLPNGTIDAIGAILDSNSVPALHVVAGGEPFTSIATSAGLGVGTAYDNGATRSNHAMLVVSGAGVTAGAVQFEGSFDNVSWFNMGAAVNTDTASTVFPPVVVSGQPVRYLRAAITTAITGGTITALVASSG